LHHKKTRERGALRGCGGKDNTNNHLKERGHEHVELGHVEVARELEAHRRHLEKVHQSKAKIKHKRIQIEKKQKWGGEGVLHHTS
jgi:hypothetical protein